MEFQQTFQHKKTADIPKLSAVLIHCRNRDLLPLLMQHIQLLSTILQKTLATAFTPWLYLTFYSPTFITTECLLYVRLSENQSLNLQPLKKNQLAGSYVSNLLLSCISDHINVSNLTFTLSCGILLSTYR